MYSTRKIHFIGICGVGMSPLAEIAVRSGFIVSGSDQSNPMEGERLSRLGIKFFPRHAPENLVQAQTVVYSSAIPGNNPERMAAQTLPGVQILHRSDFLAELLNDHDAVTVAGMHGKTTSSAMIAHMFKELGLAPTAAIGGKLLSEASYCMVGTGRLFVAESDESDGSLLKYKPLIGILTNIAKDHMDYFRDEDHIYTTFRQYLENIHPDGCAIIGWDNPISRALGHEYQGQKLAYGFTLGCDIRGREFSVTHQGIKFIAQVERDAVNCFIPTLGKVNAINALCALAVARALNLDVDKAAQSLASFEGVERRLNIVFSNARTRIIDDYAHNPDKIESAIAAVKDAWPETKLIVCFQPHRYSRISSLLEHFASSFKRADQVLVLPVYAAGEDFSAGYEPDRIAKVIENSSHVTATAMADFLACRDEVLRSQPGSFTLLTVGAGDVWRVGDFLKEVLNG